VFTENVVIHRMFNDPLWNASTEMWFIMVKTKEEWRKFSHCSSAYCPYICFPPPLAPFLGSSLSYWSTGLITQFLGLSQAVGLLGRVISPLQGLYLNTGQHKRRKMRTYIKCPGQDSNPQSRPPSDRRLFMPKNARLPRPAYICLEGLKRTTEYLN
jgi:hypothetical protein